MPIVRGDPDASEVFKRLLHEDVDERMPPANTNKTVTPDQITLVRKWIEQGAEYEQHWAWLPPVEQDVPLEWKGREIDYFVHTVLGKQGLTPSPPAEESRLIRRLYLDIVGLPPTGDELRRAQTLDYAVLVDQLLESPHYGERMAIPWLDLVRYADTVGYHGDQPMSVSPYRDYVIDAFNSNMPFDRFTREQIAGDLLSNPTQAQKVASGYNRLNMTTEEGGSQPKEYLSKYAGDRVRTTSVAWMGATLGCAECHDHKFDPYTTKDFYAMEAFFADIEEVGVYNNRGRPPEMVVHDEAERSAIAAIEEQLAIQKAALENDVPGLREGQARWESELLQSMESNEPFDFAWIDDDETSPEGKLSGGWNAVKTGDGPVFSGEKSWKQQGDGMIQHYFNLAKEPIVLASGDSLYVNVWMDAANPAKTLMLQAHSNEKGTWGHRGFWGEDRITYGGIGEDSPGHRAMGPLPEIGKWVRLEIPVEQIGFVEGDEIDGLSFDQFGGLVFWDEAGIRSTTGSLRTRALPAPLLAALQVPEDERTESDASILSEHYRGVAPELESRREEIAGLLEKREELEKAGRKTLITVSTEPREMRVRPRGNWMDDSGEIVEPAVPEFLGTLNSEDRRLNRLDLADWITSNQNPLTARVFVNRLWKQYFGIGISRVLDDLGAQGEWPVHPELLDWLALEFVRSGWDVKHMVRTIVSSETYRQSSLPRPELSKIDPYNRSLARQSRFRLKAELVRDTALAASGLLVRDIGGGSVNPYQPEGYYQHLNFPKREYQSDTNQNQWRRGVYTHWQRTFLHPMMKSFDAPSRDECAADRPMSNTPLQALVLLNDPSFVECARVFAARVLREGGRDFDARLRWVFLEALSREPVAGEIAEMRSLFEKHLARFQNDHEAARAYVSAGNSPVAEGLNDAEFAAWTSVLRVVLNLHEMIARY